MRGHERHHTWGSPLTRSVMCRLLSLNVITHVIIVTILWTRRQKSAITWLAVAALLLENQYTHTLGHHDFPSGSQLQ